MMKTLCAVHFPQIYFKSTYIFHIMNMLVSLSVTHHFVETEFIVSKEKR